MIQTFTCRKLPRFPQTNVDPVHSSGSTHDGRAIAAWPHAAGSNAVSIGAEPERRRGFLDGCGQLVLSLDMQSRPLLAN
jgi:hypothetical protein